MIQQGTHAGGKDILSVQASLQHLIRPLRPGNIHDHFHSDCFPLPFHKLVLQNIVAVDDIIMMLPDIILLSAEDVIRTERTRLRPALQYLIAFFSLVISPCPFYLAGINHIDQVQLIGNRIAQINKIFI